MGHFLKKSIMVLKGDSWLQSLTLFLRKGEAERGAKDRRQWSHGVI